MGENVIRAISAYAGKPVRLWRDGGEATGVGLVERRWFTVRPPGHAPLPNLRFSLVDVPDLRLAPKLFPGIKAVWFGAGPTPAVWHSALGALAQLVSIGALRSVVPLAGLFHWGINRFRWGEHRGGMYVKVTGRAEGQWVERSWHMVAEGDDGPYIPSMPAEAILRRCLARKPPRPGARAAARELELADYDRLFVRRAIYTGRREVTAATAHEPLYRRVLGEAFDWLPGPVKALHDGSGHRRFAGVADVERGRGPLAALACRLFKLPQSAPAVPVAVEFVDIAGGELWRRTFGEQSFESEQTEGTDRWEGLIRERFGPLAVGLAAVVGRGRLDLVVRRWSLFGVPMPLWLAPGGPAFEQVMDGRFCFDVEIRLPLLGRIVRYRGWLEADSWTAASSPRDAA